MAVGEQLSRDMVIRDMVYQGTVLGPPLWNVFYEDAAIAIRVHGFCEIVFADDLNAYKAFELTAANSEIVSDLKKRQHEVHNWGKANQISFDATKESMHILALARRR